MKEIFNNIFNEMENAIQHYENLLSAAESKQFKNDLKIKISETKKIYLFILKEFMESDLYYILDQMEIKLN